MGSHSVSTWCPAAMLTGVIVAAVLGMAGDAMAQALRDVQTPDTPLVLRAQGSFFVGGEKVEQTAGELGDLGPGGHITVNQMYVRYMVPQGGDGNVPVVMVHGATLTGKSWETTPDGRMGWDEYFVRKGHPVRSRHWRRFPFSLSMATIATPRPAFPRTRHGRSVSKAVRR